MIKTLFQIVYLASKHMLCLLDKLSNILLLELESTMIISLKGLKPFIIFLF